MNKKVFLSSATEPKFLPLQIIVVFLLVAAFSACTGKPADCTLTGRMPEIEPDYSGVVIPPNIAPMNFKIKEKSREYYAIISAGNSSEIKLLSDNGKIVIPRRKWKKLLENNKGKELNVKIFTRDQNGKWNEFETLTNNIAEEPIDKYLYYRSIYPGFESWSGLSINCRDIESFYDSPLVENTVLDGNCINCHAFNNGKTNDFLFHVRGKLGGTYIKTDGKFKKFNLKAEAMKNGAVYPRWHPSGNFVAFSSNSIIQQFHAGGDKKVEVTDLQSSLVLYDVTRNEIMDVSFPDSEKVMDTYPEWSSDGEFLYFCRTSQIGENFEYDQIRYNLYRVKFNSGDRSFGEAELIYDASSLKKSVSFPRISPDGRFLVMTVSDYGCFPIWHKEADLYLMNLETMETSRMNLNSEFTESYHSWASSSKWLVFSSKRDNGLTGLPYIAYIDSHGTSAKAFILPQKDPVTYLGQLRSFNIPEFSTFRVKRTPGELRAAAISDESKVKWIKK